MNCRRLWRYVCAAIVSSMMAAAGFGQDSAKTPESGAKAATPGGRHVYYVGPLGRGSKIAAGVSANREVSSGSGTFGTTKVSGGEEGNENSGGLPLWTFRVHSSRDGHSYPGTMVGSNPFTDPGTTAVPTVVIPIRIRTKSVGTKVDPMTGAITTEPGDTTFDPGAPDNSCLSAPNNVPVTLVKQSPMFTPTAFSFGGTFVGTTEYNDAFQRANFWGVSSKERSDYHVLLKPTQFLQPIEMDPPDFYGLALTDGTVLEAALGTTTPFCAPLGIVDVNWFDTMLTSTVIPELRERGIINPGTFPLFFVYNVFWAAPVDNFFLGCCIGGYHGTTGFPIPTQTYSPADFDSTGVFGVGASDTVILAHEVDEWMNDPMISNPTPPWGRTGQVGFCQANLEVGDPLTGTNIPAITMPNGFTYHLQELAFFSWFFGAPSIGVNGWYSDNNTFTTDAGPLCH
jgi:hypothetical protein